MIPYARQDISDEDIESVVAVLRSAWLTQGPAIDEFERSVANYCGAEQGIAVSSATAALHLACLAVDLGPGDFLWTSSNTFVASANCARYCGATVDFVDIERKTGNMSAQALKEKLVLAEKSGNLPKVVVAVDFAGHPCDMSELLDLKKKYGFILIEDASHAIGSSYRGLKTGAGSLADLTIFSFHPVKILTTGEGGMLLTNNTAIADRVARLRTHGITRKPEEMVTRPDGPWYYEQIELGYNYRITDIQAALGTSQLKRLDQFVSRRRHLADRYQIMLQGLPIVLPREEFWAISAFHLYVVQVDYSRTSRTRLEVYEALRSSGIAANVHYIPVHLQPYYRNLGFGEGYCPEAENYYRSALSLPMYFGLTDGEQNQVVECLRKIHW